MVYGIALSILAAGFAFLAFEAPLALAPFLAWCALAAGVVALGYLGLGPGVFGKSPAGTRAPWASVLLAPYFGGVAIARWLQRTITGEDAYNLVAPGLYVGRLVDTKGLPDDVALVVDLTAELTEPVQTRTRLEYRCLPTLDGTAPPADALRAFALPLEDEPRPIYIHCAAGHGRAAMLASIVLVRRGHADDTRGAEQHMRKVRPKVRMTGQQHRHATQALEVES
ncbi:MAG: hypothetical protein AAGE52_03930 [Myxococcota bacterium]